MGRSWARLKLGHSPRKPHEPVHARKLILATPHSGQYQTALQTGTGGLRSARRGSDRPAHALAPIIRLCAPISDTPQPVLVRYHTSLVRPARDAAPTESPIKELPPHGHRKERDMALDFPPFVVHVERPVGILLCTYFGEMRTWLDAHKIAPVDFRLWGGSSIGVDIAFSSPEDASLFKREFA